jgi:CxxC-x17-CxxC domain-containing protein
VNILSEARKYRLSLILANQYLGQLDEMGAGGKSSRVRDAVFGNVGTIITFRVGAEDAEFLEPEFTPEIVIEDFVNLGKYHIYLKLMIDGITSAPFSATTLPPMEKIETSEKEKIIRSSRERYSVPRDVIEEKIAKWSGEMNEAAAKTPAMPATGQTQPKMHEITCSMCNKKTKVIFEPEPGRKVYCKPCLKKLQAANVGHSDNDSRTVSDDSARPRALIAAAPADIAPRQDAAPAGNPRLSLLDLAHTQPVRFAGQKNDSSNHRPRKEVQIDELKKALGEALGNAPKDEKPTEKL